MDNIDIALVLDKIRPGAAWRMCDTYENLKNTWEDTEQTLPTEQEIIDAWNEIQNINEDEVKKAKLDEINLAFKALRTRIVDQELSIRLDNNDETLIEQELTKLKEEYQTTHQNLLNKQEEILNG